MQKVKYIPDKNYPTEKVHRLMQMPDRALPWTRRPAILVTVPDAENEPEYVCQILNFDYDAKTNKGSVDTIFSTDLEAKQAKPLEHIQMAGTLLDLKQEKVVGTLQPVETSNRTFCELRTGFVLDTPMDDPKNLALLVEAEWKDEFGESGMDLLHENNSSQGDCTYEHLRPKKEASPVRIGDNFLDKSTYTEEERRPCAKSDRIRIVFKRAPEVTADVDYICMFGTVKDDHPNFGVPGCGILGMEGGTIIMEGDDAPSATCTVVGVNGAATKKYEIDYPGAVFQNDGGKLKYDIAMGWNQRYDEPGNFTPVQFDYTLKINAVFQVGSRKRKVVQVVTSRSSGDNKAFEHSIPQLEFMWGCFAADVRIRMTDGTEKEAQDIRIGDAVRTAQDSGVVVNVWKGREDKMIRLTYGAGHHLDLTGNHPVLTRDGWYRAAALKLGMQAKTEAAGREEWTALEAVEWVDYGHEVYNFELKRQDGQEPAVIFANGLGVSDFMGQNQIQCAGEK